MERGTQGTLSDGHSGFMVTLVHLASHHSDEQGRGVEYTFNVWVTMVVIITPHTHKCKLWSSKSSTASQRSCSEIKANV